MSTLLFPFPSASYDTLIDMLSTEAVILNSLRTIAKTALKSKIVSDLKLLKDGNFTSTQLEMIKCIPLINSICKTMIPDALTSIQKLQKQSNFSLEDRREIQMLMLLTPTFKPTITVFKDFSISGKTKDRSEYYLEEEEQIKAFKRLQIIKQINASTR